MKQIALDIGLACVPSSTNYLAGPNEPALSHLQLWAGSALRSPVPTYLWGPTGSGKSFLNQCLASAGFNPLPLNDILLNPPRAGWLLDNAQQLDALAGGDPRRRGSGR